MFKLQKALPRMLLELLEHPLKGLTIIFGPAGSGKTTLCLQLLAGRSIYISTGRNFSADRLKTMRRDADALLGRLVVFEPVDLLALEKSVEAAVKLSRLSDLIVIDSLATYLRLAERKAGNLALHRILQTLLKANCPVLLTTEIYDTFSEGHGVRLVGGEMLRLAADTLIELDGKVLTVRKHKEFQGRARDYRITDAGLEKV